MMKSFYEIDGYPFDEEVTSNNFDYFIKNENLGQSFTIKYKGEIAGYMIINFLFSFEFGGHICFLDELYIKPEFQGKSLGKKAVLHAQDFASKKDLKLIYLEVEHHNERAKHLYETLGFENHKRGLMYFKP